MRKTAQLNEVLYNLFSALKFVAGIISPFLPDSSEKIMNMLGLNDVGSYTAEFFLDFYNIEQSKVAKKDMLFERIEYKNEGEKKESEKKIPIDEFFNVDLKVAKILEAEGIEKSRKLIKLKIDVGEESPRTLVAGLKEHYKPEELVGRYIIVVANLKPAKLMGIESNGMLLAAKDGENLALLTVEKPVKPGAKIS